MSRVYKALKEIFISVFDKHHPEWAELEQSIGGCNHLMNASGR